MPINPAIAMGFQPPKLDDPMNRLVQMEQLKAYQQNALAKQLEMQVAQEGLSQQQGLKNYLAGLQPGQQADLSGLAQFGKTGLEYGKALSGFQKEQQAADKSKLDAAMTLHKDYYVPQLANVSTARDALEWAKRYRSDPRMGPLVAQTSDEQAFAMLPANDEAAKTWAQRMLNPSTYDKNAIAAKQAQEKEINKAYSELYKFDPNSGKQIIDPGVQQRLQVLLSSYQKQFGNQATDVLSQPIEGGLPGARAGGPPPLVVPAASGVSVGTPEINTADVAGSKAYAQEVAKLGARDEQAIKDAAKRVDTAYKIIGFNPENYDPNDPKTFSDTEKLISESTSGPVESYLASMSPSLLYGQSTKGMEKIGELKTIASQLTNTFLGGKLGAGISDADRNFIQEQIGSIGNEQIPANQRLAAFRRFMTGLGAMKRNGYIIAPKESEAKGGTAEQGGWDVQEVTQEVTK